MVAPRRISLVAAVFLPQLFGPGLEAPLSAQLSPSWERLVGGPLVDGSAEPACRGSSASRKSILATADGGALVLGRTIAGPGGPYLARYDPSGAVAWYRTLPEVQGVGFGMELSRSVGEAVVVAGTHEPDGYPAGRDVWVERLSPNGESMFFVSLDFGHGPDDVGPRIATNADGRIYGSASHSGGTTIFALSTLGGSLWNSYFAGEVVLDIAAQDGRGVAVALTGANGARIVALDGAGSVSWSHAVLADPGRTESVRAIAASPSGAIGLVGSSCSATECDLLAGSIGASGRLAWLRRLAAPEVGPSAGRGVAVDDGGRLFVAGTHVPPGSAGARAFVAAIDAVGGLSWFDSVAFGSPSLTVSSSFEAVEILAGNQLLVAGSTELSSSNANLLAATYDRSSGDPGWVRHFDSGMNRDDEACDVDVGAARDRAMVTGSARLATADQWTLSFGAGGEPFWSVREPSLQPPEDRLGGSWAPMGAVRGALAVDSSGEVIVAGTGTDGENSGALVAKLDAAGALTSFDVLPDVGRTSSSYAAAVAGPNGEAFAAGKSRFGASDAFLTVKLDPNGKREWIREIRDIGGAEARRIVAMPDGGVVVTGVIRPNHNDDLLTVRFSRDGEKIWSARLDEFNESGFDLARRSEGVVVLADSTPEVGSSRECLVAAYSNAGVEAWRVRLGDTSGPPASTLCSAIASDPADRTYVAGRKFEGPFVVRLLQDGRIDWRTTVRPAGSESTISALGVVGGLGTVVVGPVLTSSGWKGWAALLSDSGDVQWIVNFEGESSEFIARDLTIGADDHIYVAATSHDVLGLVILDSKGNLVDLVRSSATEGGSVDSAPAAVTSTSFGRIVAAASADTPGTSDDILVVSIDLPAVFRDGFEGGDPSGWAASDPRKKSCGGRHDELGPDC